MFQYEIVVTVFVVINFEEVVRLNEIKKYEIEELFCVKIMEIGD